MSDGAFTFRGEKEEETKVAVVPTFPAKISPRGKAEAKVEIQKPEGLKGLIPEEEDMTAQEKLVTDPKKTKEYYDGLEINMEDVDLLENRVEELERYIGIEGKFNVDYFTKNEIEKLD